jgi:hypothetical protein
VKDLSCHQGNKTNKVFTRQTLKKKLKTYKALHRRTVGKPSLQQKRRLKAIGLPQQK